MALPGKANFRNAINEYGGVVGDIAAHFSVTRRTVYNWLNHYDLRGVLDAAKSELRSVAKDVVYDSLMEGDVNTARFVLTHLTTDGEFITISPDVLRLLPAIGMSVEDASSIFEDMVREAAKQKARVA